MENAELLEQLFIRVGYMETPADKRKVLYGMIPSRLRFILFVYLNPPPITQNQLYTSLGFDRYLTLLAFNYLNKLGYVRKRESPTRRGITNIERTLKGQEFVHQIGKRLARGEFDENDEFRKIEALRIEDIIETIRTAYDSRSLQSQIPGIKKSNGRMYREKINGTEYRCAIGWSITKSEIWNHRRTVFELIEDGVIKTYSKTDLERLKTIQKKFMDWVSDGGKETKFMSYINELFDMKERHKKMKSIRNKKARLSRAERGSKHRRIW